MKKKVQKNKYTFETEWKIGMDAWFEGCCYKVDGVVCVFDDKGAHVNELCLQQTWTN